MAIRTIEAVVEIDEDRKLIVQLPPDVPTGRHRVVAVLDEAEAGSPEAEASAGAWAFPILEQARWPADMPLTREQMYGDDGR
jgi:hypothetical protein